MADRAGSVNEPEHRPVGVPVAVLPPTPILVVLVGLQPFPVTGPGAHEASQRQPLRAQVPARMAVRGGVPVDDLPMAGWQCRDAVGGLRTHRQSPDILHRDDAQDEGTHGKDAGQQDTAPVEQALPCPPERPGPGGAVS